MGHCAGEAVADAGGVECCGMIEGRYPALLFRQQVDALVQKAFPMLSENIKNTLEPMLVSSCSAISCRYYLVLTSKNVFCLHEKALFESLDRGTGCCEHLGRQEKLVLFTSKLCCN